MTTSEHPAWTRALARFRDGYGADFDPAESSDVGPFLELLEHEVRTDLTSELVDTFNEATARIERETARMLSEVRP